MKVVHSLRKYTIQNSILYYTIQKEAMKVVHSLRKYTATELQKLAKTVKLKNQKGGIATILSPGQIYEQKGGLYKPYNHRREFMYFK